MANKRKTFKNYPLSFIAKLDARLMRIVKEEKKMVEFKALDNCNRRVAELSAENTELKKTIRAYQGSDTLVRIECLKLKAKWESYCDTAHQATREVTRLKEVNQKLLEELKSADAVLGIEGYQETQPVRKSISEAIALVEGTNV